MAVAWSFLGRGQLRQDPIGHFVFSLAANDFRGVRPPRPMPPGSASRSRSKSRLAAQSRAIGFRSCSFGGLLGSKSDRHVRNNPLPLRRHRNRGCENGFIRSVTVSCLDTIGWGRQSYGSRRDPTPGWREALRGGDIARKSAREMTNGGQRLNSSKPTFPRSAARSSSDATNYRGVTAFAVRHVPHTRHQVRGSRSAFHSLLARSPI